jgi:DNA-binding transcriptional MerR regulator
MSERLYKAKEFAERAGVTVRALHLYDRMGLLPPAQRTQSGYRLYGHAELERLEQIVALRFIGFSLQEINELLDAQALPLDVALRMQREIIRRRRGELDRALDAIERAQEAIEAAKSNGAEPVWEALRTVIEVMKMENGDWSWTKNYYTPEAQAKIDARAATIPKEQLEAGQRAWTQLIAEVEAAAKTEAPESERAQQLAARWKALVGEFTGGDPQIRDGLNKLWTDRTHWPANLKRPWSDEADAFIRVAMNCNL